MTRTNIEKTYVIMREEAKSLGVTLLTKEDAFFDDEHLDCIWYGGYIGGFAYKDYAVSFEACGEVEVFGFVKGKDFHYRNRHNTGAMDFTASDILRKAFKNDKEWINALNADDEEETRVWFENNNWIEAFILDKEDNVVSSFVVETTDNVLEACADMKPWVDWINENFYK